MFALPLAVGNALAQDEAADDDSRIDEVVVTGTQIKGARISDALAVSVVTAEDIEILGVDSGDELLEFMAEQGSNFHTEAENISGGVNSARGDMGAYNLRNLGTGNTLVLLNGRRMVNAASYQTELVGGSFVPVNSVNSQSLPVFGLERVEVLRDGASAIYGADAVAGVVNYVMKKEYEGLSLRARYNAYDGLPSTNQRLTVEWGRNFNGGNTNFSLFADYYHRDRINSQDDPKWANDDYRRLLPEGSPWAEPDCEDRDVNGGDDACTRFYNSSTNSEYGQFDINTSVNPSSNRDRYGLVGNDITDTAGEFQVYPVGHPDCDWAFYPGAGVCGNDDDAPIYRYNNNEDRDLFSDLDRVNVFAFLNHEFASGVESFTEVSAYLSYTNTIRHASARLGSVAKYQVPAENYWNPFGVCTLADGSDNPNRLPFELIGDDTNGGVPCAGFDLSIDNYRWTQVPRIVDNDGETFRILQGFRGEMGSWDWEGAVSWSRATKEDVTHNRISNTIITQMLNDSTPSAYNPFIGRDADITPALIDVRRDNETELKSIDFRVSKNDLFGMPAGQVGMVAGIEFRQESFVDDRDPRLDGTIEFIDDSGAGFPLVADVMNSSPSLDSKGERDVTSAFVELQIPLASNFDVQAAMRYEDFSDVGDTTVGKIAVGWRPAEQLLFRGSISEAYRVPNLVTVNESGVARTNPGINDFPCFYAKPGDAECSYSMQRTAGGSSSLVPEESTNASVGLVFSPNEHLTLTVDYWSIEKDDTIGLFGEENHTALDLLRRIEAGTGNCASAVGNPAVVRGDPATLEQEEIDLYLGAGICPAAPVLRVEDTYANLDTRKIKGHDIGVYFNYDSSVGTFDLRYVAAYLTEYSQVPSGPALELLTAIDDGVLPAGLSIRGFSDLIRQNGNPKEKHTLRLSWRNNDWGASMSGVYVSDLVQTALTFDDGNGPLYVVPSMYTFNASLDYEFKTFGDTDARVRFGINNVFDERAPLADVRFGYWSDVHRDLPRAYYLDLKLDF
ncbi:MAG: TonB-dependent receptor [Gammaproteobacteria bacterium]|nr:TonB-dependent receptor [Gammaproteobacteria bacterium]